MDGQFHIILADEIDNTQRTLLHEQIKKISKVWWHDLPNVWLTCGDHNSEQIRDLLTPIVPINPSTIAILALKTLPAQRWATRGKLRTIGDWWKETLASPEPEENP